MNDRLEVVCLEIANAYEKARDKHKPMNSPHEGYAVILEELDELWDEVKGWQPKSSFAGAMPERDYEYQQSKLRKEALHVAAMALAFIVDVTDE